MSDDLVERLRGDVSAYEHMPEMSGIVTRMAKAAARIEALEAERDEALEHAAKRCEHFANLYADMALYGLPENARNREAMEATATKLAAVIRAEKSTALAAGETK
jgi:hypothetical protein